MESFRKWSERKRHSAIGIMYLFLMLVLLDGITVQAADAKVQTLPADVAVPAEGCTLVGVEGSFRKPEKALEKINKIRLEACQEGVPNPADPSRKLTMADYVPVKWSRDLEYISRIRAAECLVSFAHIRPNGKGYGSIDSPNGVWGYCEVIAGASYADEEGAEFGIDIWYREKSSWVKQNEHAVTGHYTAMIDPENVYVGLGCFISSVKEYGCSAAQFCGEWHGNDGSIIAIDERMMEGVDNCIQILEVKNDYLSAPMLYRDTGLSDEELEEGKRAGMSDPELVVGDTEQYHLAYWFNDDGERTRVLVPGNISWSSGNSKIAAVDQNGNVKYKKKGSVQITAASDTGVTVSSKIKITHKAVKKTSVTKLKGGKRSFTVTFKKQKKVDGYGIQYSKNKKFTGNNVYELYIPQGYGNSQKVTRLKKGTYYVRVRTYLDIKGWLYDTDWSKAKKVKVR
ncbi:MAG: CAP domain-containing protein [Clostridium sp.]|nr:CAP domain-containing protein [Clostridium sp.]